MITRKIIILATLTATAFIEIVIVALSQRQQPAINTDTTTSWKQYQNDAFGYTISLPSTWVRHEYPVNPEPGFMSFFSRPGIGAPLEQLRDDLSLDVTVRSNKKSESLETVAARTIRNLDDTPGEISNTVSSSEHASVDGYEAIIQLEHTPSGIGSEVGYQAVMYVNSKERIIIVSVLGNNAEVIVENNDLINKIFRGLSI